MILSGWILPDLFEVECRSCSSYYGHIEVLKRYLENLKLQDQFTFNKIIKNFTKLQEIYPYLGLDDFAVKCLGWIKLSNKPIKILFVGKMSPIKHKTRNYEKIGYSIVVLDYTKLCFEVDIPSKELI